MFKLFLIQKPSFALLLILMVFSGCDKENISGNWLIPTDEVLDGGPGKDGIPALENPDMTAADGAFYLNDDDLVLGIKVGSEVRAYPHPILDRHEIINENINGISLAITYCPLTGTGIGWDRFINGKETTFGVSGLLYNTNVIPYDRETDSHWSQMRLDCVNGENTGRIINTHHLVETTWESWKSMYPQTKVVSANTGHDRDYTIYPYGDYQTNHQKLLFPVSFEDNRLPWKERVLGIIEEDEARTYSIEKFGSGVTVIQEDWKGKSLVIAGSKTKNFIVAFESVLEGESLSFSPLHGTLPLIMEDQNGTKWDLFGKGISGPGTGKQLTTTRSFMGFWFAFGAFYPGAEIYEE